jgi:hypothetical protein
VENGIHNFKELAEQYAKILAKFGAVKDATPVGVESGLPPFVVLATGGNSVSKAVKARKLGWKPTRESVFDSLEETVSRLVKN